jgi:hypothetical protein
MSRVEMLDRINCLLTFAQCDDGSDGADEAMALMRWNHVTADELNARRASTARPYYRPVYAR